MKPIVIVGAGLAGLAAATALHHRNIPFILIEKRSQVGGRVFSEQIDGYTLDHGFQVLQTNYPLVKRLFDLSKLDLSYFESGAFIRTPQKTWKTFLNPLRFPWALADWPFTLKDILLFARLWFVIQWNKDTLSASKESTQGLLDRWGFSDVCQQTFLKPFLAGIFLDQSLSQSAAMFTYFMQQFVEGQVALPAKGISAIPEQLASGLPEGSIRFNEIVVRMDENSLTTSAGETIAFSRLILAVDAMAAAKILDVSLPSGVFLDCTIHYFSCDTLPARDRLLHLIPAGESAILHYVILSQIAPAYAPEGKELIAVTTLDLQQTPESIREALAAYEDCAAWTFIKMIDVPFALPRQGEFQSLVDEAKRLDLILAGDYVQFPSLQGALEAGQIAARQIV